MYGEAFCKVYNEFGWNYFPEAFGEQLLIWLQKHNVTADSCLDLGCGTGVLCEILHGQGKDVWGMDFSENMIAIARERNREIHYEVGDMITYLPDKQFDLVTCTGDALNHIVSLEDVEKIFQNVHQYLKKGGYFIFDVLSEEEVPDNEPFDLEFSESVKAKFQVTKNEKGMIQLKTSVFENGEFQFEEKILETVHDIHKICELLEKSGLQVESCDHHLLDDKERQVATWYVIARENCKDADISID